ncbi:ADP-ribosylglycohydrolase [Lacrimispora sphenoides]|jgi:ADP-ribosylglycohydrolase|uniref:ADP-ribosylglycohydrolase family protein n=1 Tax=Lacrimispora sphenoides TaxID=29370 RepID=UPI0008CC6833|nr:ADP-ribosylglycohydrolase family protein [Lacrimispora sphenoides]SEU25422.1 ADP-ribosylglycohydrolase [Lacrimispora sphenoides]
MIPDKYLEKVYSGFLGMNIGIRLGAPVEPTIWTYERILNTYGEITDYVKDYKNFAADDDVNGPVYFLRALYDDAKDGNLKPQDVARAWLNYAREGVSMFWWGGYGISTEHTAYLNLKQGIPAPQSGSMNQNGQLLAEQIGGQIFIDTWGLVNPCQPDKAAEFGQSAASVSHDGEGIYGARFFCACIANAFRCQDIHEIIQVGLSQIPGHSIYAKVVNEVLDFYKKNNNWRDCYNMLVRDWGYDKYGGVCHIIPNAGVCALSMVYGNGDFARTVEIATMCGWDTDCNAGNVGTVLGVMCGIEGLPKKYRKPMNDGIILSGISGYLNNLDVPTYAKEVALLGYRLAEEEAPVSLLDSIKEGEVHFDFELPGSTHNMRVSNSFYCTASHSTDVAYKGNGSLKILVDRMTRGNQCKLFYKPFYRREEFSDERYMPVFTPTVYPGQTVSMKLYLDQWNGWETLGIAPYVRSMSDKKEHLQGYIKLVQGEWIDVTFVIPEVDGDLIDEVGIVMEGYSIAKAKTLGFLYLDEFFITGKSKYTVKIAKQRNEFGTITPFSVNHGAWGKDGDKLSLMRCEPAFAYAGNYFSKDVRVTVPVTPINGESHLLQIRAQGAMRGYIAGFSEEGKAAIYKNDFGYKKMIETDFAWKLGTAYKLTLEAVGDMITLSIDDEKIIEMKDDSFRYGMFGCGSIGMGRTLFGDFEIMEI